MNYAQQYFQEVKMIADAIDTEGIGRLALALRDLRNDGGRLFFLGVGGGAGNCSHAVNDFRKLCGIESYAPSDNVPELTARTNDEGWNTVFAEWLKTSKAGPKDGLFIFSVGGGDAEKNVSANIVLALDEAKARGCKVFGVVGRQGGYTKQVGTEVIVVPQAAPSRITPHTEAFQAVVWHCLVSDPVLNVMSTKWEGLSK